MSNPTERLKYLMGGEASFTAAEASAQKSQNIGRPQQTSHFEGMAGRTDPNDALSKPLLPSGLFGTPLAGPGSGQQDPGDGPAISRLPPHRNKSKEADKQHWCNSIRRAQRYLGLRSASKADALLIEFEAIAPYPCELDAILIAVDVEADETDPSLITEIGIATLDTRGLKNIEPGYYGSHWLAQVRGQHFRILEGTHVRNHRYVQGNPEGFHARFGKSVIVPQCFVGPMLSSCLTHVDLLSPSGDFRNIVLIGHNVRGDLRWLESLGVSLLDTPNLIEVLTTDEMQKAMKRDSAGATSLARLLEETDIVAHGLHNAGNDAAYTLQAFIAMALKSLSVMRPIVSLEDRIAEAVARARERTLAEWAAWDVAEQNSGNGNEPIPYRFSKLRE